MTTTSSPAPYCGDPPMRAGRLFARDAAGGVPALFAGRRVAWAFKTRVAIRAAVDLLGLEPGDEVLAPAYNCGSEIDPLLDAGLSVRLYPVGRDTGVDLDAVARLIGPRTRAIYVTHYFGMLQPHLPALRALCDARGLRLIEDCALSLLSSDAPAEGRTGDVSVFCLYKFFPVLAGGALVVNAPDLAEPAGLFDRPAPRAFVAKSLVRTGLRAVPGGRRAIAAVKALRKNGAEAAPEPAAGRPDMPANYYFDPGFRNARISAFAARPIRAFDVAAAIAARHENWGHYMAGLDGLAGVTPLYPALPAGACPLNMPVLVRDRDAMADALQARGIAATPWWSGYHRGLDWSGQDDAAHLKDHVLALPLHQHLGAAHVSHIVATLRDLLH